MDQIKIGRFIAARRRERGMTQRELAEALGLSNRTISKWECGDGLPELVNILPLCELLGVTADELLRGGRE
jgi:transcriptional regulator with XRE-family HTH domain